MIELKNVHKHFGQLHVLKGITNRIESGEVVVIIGPSGSGKSTLLRCINYLEEPTEGEIAVDGIKLNHSATNINRVRREVGMVFNLNLFPHMTVTDVLPARSTQDWRRQKRKDILWSTGKVGLSDSDGVLATVVRGQQHEWPFPTLAPARRIILFDDFAARSGEIGEVLDVMKLANDGMTMVVVSQRWALPQVGDRVLFMDDERV